MQDINERHGYTSTNLANLIPVVHQRLETLRRERSLDPLKDLFWSDLSYTRVNKMLATRHWPQTLQDTLLSTIKQLFWHWSQ